MTLRAGDSILVYLLEGEKSTADIVFELDFRPSTVYTALSEQVSAGWIALRRVRGKRGSYSLTEAGRVRAKKIGELASLPSRNLTQTVFHAVKAGAETYEEVVKLTELDRIKVYSAMQRLMKGNRVVRTDSLGKGGRGGSVAARFAACR